MKELGDGELVKRKEIDEMIKMTESKYNSNLPDSFESESEMAEKQFQVADLPPVEVRFRPEPAEAPPVHREVRF